MKLVLRVEITLHDKRLPAKGDLENFVLESIQDKVDKQRRENPLWHGFKSVTCWLAEVYRDET